MPWVLVWRCQLRSMQFIIIELWFCTVMPFVGYLVSTVHIYVETLHVHLLQYTVLLCQCLFPSVLLLCYIQTAKGFKCSIWKLYLTKCCDKAVEKNSLAQGCHRGVYEVFMFISSCWSEMWTSVSLLNSIWVVSALTTTINSHKHVLTLQIQFNSIQ